MPALLRSCFQRTKVNFASNYAFDYDQDRVTVLLSIFPSILPLVGQIRVIVEIAACRSPVNTRKSSPVRNLARTVGNRDSS